MESAVELSDSIAPEHLEICCAEPFEVLKKVRNAGSVFLGNYSPEALGDYLAGTNHTLPTMGTARFSGPLSVDDFVKRSSWIYYDRQALGGVQNDIRRFAQCEGLGAHANSVAVRFERE